MKKERKKYEKPKLTLINSVDFSKSQDQFNSKNKAIENSSLTPKEIQNQTKKD